VSSSTALEDLEHFDCYCIKNWGGCATLDCRYWSMDCSMEDNCFVPHSLLAPNPQMIAKDKS
jgi:hypothetical protein